MVNLLNVIELTNNSLITFFFYMAKVNLCLWGVELFKGFAVRFPSLPQWLTIYIIIYTYHKCWSIMSICIFVCGNCANCVYLIVHLNMFYLVYLTLEWCHLNSVRHSNILYLRDLKHVTSLALFIPVCSLVLEIVIRNLLPLVFFFCFFLLRRSVNNSQYMNSLLILC